ncbi:hypothetical protein IW136_003897, partial [Coemansia sp. RSA 678]
MPKQKPATDLGSKAAEDNASSDEYSSASEVEEQSRSSMVRVRPTHSGSSGESSDEGSDSEGEDNKDESVDEEDEPVDEEDEPVDGEDEA